ncbi:hypothetical protein N5T98_06870 [Aliarcobacter cryaerophilus]|uniref:hypothetical protein n=1 Tax=Aliarcobacter cryaerophilus TaxID=28198 RepID=UPI0021B621B6|nr:hypothetical protein [Aliarcobacter cryaerophilus]MCT7486744.1 hypothetical protein [Aliarcobacter cryaerophilus]MCT7490809.1 hypothetical protein [Aliarcobacter cryaerophilus]
MKRKIVIIHPEGNIFNNPNLYEIILFLSIHFDLHILLPELEINRKYKKNNFTYKIIEYSDIYNNENLILEENLLLDFIKRYSLGQYDFVIGIDRIGIFLAYAINCFYDTKYGFISYELFFENETSKEFKSIEKLACIDIEFAIIQDKQRGLNLQQENNIPFEKMLYIPVAGSTKYKYKKSYFVYDILNIDYKKKMLIYTGSIASWSCFKEIFEKAVIPENWVLVIHDRYGSSFEKLNKIVKKLPDNVYFLDIELCSNRDMYKILHSADLGLALYCPNYISPYTGKNILDIGLSSGKISTYLQNGLPIVTTYNEILSSYMQKYSIGYMLHSITELESILLKHKSKEMYHKDSLIFFESVLSLKNYEKSFLFKIKQALKPNTEIKQDSFEKKRNLFKNFFIKQKKLDFSKKFNKLFETINNLKQTKCNYIIYGNGTISKTIQALIPDKIIGYVDIADENNHPKNLKNMKYDKIIISVLGREEEIIKYLVEDLKIARDKIITLEV